MLKRMNQIINKMHCSLVIYPEARFSFAGILEDMGSALGKMAKFCKCRIIVLNQKGNFLRSPQWCKSPKRKVPCICDFTQIASKEEVEQLSAEELEKRIFSAMEYDEYRWQYEIIFALLLNKEQRIFTVSFINVQLVVLNLKWILLEPMYFVITATRLGI